MKVSRERMEENRARILDAASRLFRERGFDDVTVSEIMQAAGFTHGGFYGHFTSKDELIAQAVAHALAPGQGQRAGVGALIENYLSPLHRDNAAEGCPTAGLAGSLRHQSAEARAAMAVGNRRQIDYLAGSLPGATAADRRCAAIGSWAAMVGAVIIARAIDDPALSDELLSQTRAWIEKGAQLPG